MEPEINDLLVVKSLMAGLARVLEYELFLIVYTPFEGLVAVISVTTH